MSSRDQMNKNYSAVEKRLGKTTGASKGKQSPPPAKVKIKPSLKKPRITWEKKF